MFLNCSRPGSQSPGPPEGGQCHPVCTSNKATPGGAGTNTRCSCTPCPLDKVKSCAGSSNHRPASFLRRTNRPGAGSCDPDAFETPCGLRIFCIERGTGPWVASLNNVLVLPPVVRDPRERG